MSHILESVLLAMQEAEERGGPEGQAYLDLMSAIAREATRRYNTYAEVLGDHRCEAWIRIVDPAAYTGRRLEGGVTVHADESDAGSDAGTLVIVGGPRKAVFAFMTGELGIEPSDVGDFMREP
jgi:hypothetical protein